MDVKVKNNKLRVACRSYRIGFGALSLSSWTFAFFCFLIQRQYLWESHFLCYFIPRVDNKIPRCRGWSVVGKRRIWDPLCLRNFHGHVCFSKSLEISIGLKIIARRLRYTISVGITGGKPLQITKIDDSTNQNPLPSENWGKRNINS